MNNVKNIKQEEFGQLCCLLGKYKYELALHFFDSEENQEEMEKIMVAINIIMSSKFVPVDYGKEVKK